MLFGAVPLFVFLKSDPKQNARSLLTPVSDPAFHALSHGSLSFALHGSFLNHFLIGGYVHSTYAWGIGGWVPRGRILAYGMGGWV